jgi:hypothetical protein
MANRLDGYVAAGCPAGVPPPRRSGILQGVHAAVDRLAERMQEKAAGEQTAPILERISAAEALITELKGDPPSPITSELAQRYREILAEAQGGLAAADGGE